MKGQTCGGDKFFAHAVGIGFPVGQAGFLAHSGCEGGFSRRARPHERKALDSHRPFPYAVKDRQRFQVVTRGEVWNHAHPCVRLFGL